MTVSIVENTELPAPPEDAFRLIASVEGMTLFTGFGLVPGIARVETSDGVRGVGTEDVVHNQDGSIHRERVVAFDPPHLYGLAIGPFEGPFGRLVEGAEERWELSACATGTRVRRRFTFTPRGWLGRVMLSVVLGPQFRSAMRRNHNAMQDRLRTGVP